VRLQLPWVRQPLLGAGWDPGWHHSWASHLHNSKQHTQLGLCVFSHRHQFTHASSQSPHSCQSHNYRFWPPLPDLTICTKCMRVPHAPHLWLPGVRHQQHLPAGLQVARQQESHPGRRVGQQQGVLSLQARLAHALLPWLCRAGAAQSPSGPQPHRPPGTGQPAGPG
jgi:hypothetical protein